MKKRKEVDMLHGPLSGKLIVFAMPLAISSIIQYLFNSADVAVVGRFAGSDALAATGSCTALVAVFVNLIVGMAAGPNAYLAMMIGQKRNKEINDAVHTAMTFGLLMAAALTLAGMVIVEGALSLAGTPSEIIGQAVLYARIYMLGLPFMVFYNFGAAIMRSYGETKISLYCLLSTGVVNVLLNLLFVIVFGWGVAGVAGATTIANMISALVIFIVLSRRSDEFCFRFGRMKIRGAYLGKMLAIGAPAGIQGALFSFSNVFIQSGINTFGTDGIAGAAVGLNFEYFTYAIVLAFSSAAVTFAGQCYGAGDIRRCGKIYRRCMLYGFVFTEILALTFMVFGRFFVGIYTNNPVAQEYALQRMWHVAAWEGLCVLFEVSSGIARGMGKSLEPAIFTVLGVVVLRVIWLYTIFRIYPTFAMLMNVYLCSWLFTGACIHVILYRRFKQLYRLHQAE